MNIFNSRRALSIVFVSFSVLSLGCDAEKSKDESPTEDSSAAITADGHQKVGHGKGDAGHAPKDAAESNQKIYLASISWSSPLVAGSLANEATLTFWEPRLHTVGAKLKSFKLFMPAMGHGSIKTDQMVLTQDPADPSVWKISNIYFSMPGGAGEWVVDIEAEVNGQSDKVRLGIAHEVGE